MTRLEADESVRARWLRRAVTVPAYLVAGAAALVLCPFLLLVAAIADLVRGRRPFVLSRAVLGISLYLVCEAGGVVASALIWLAWLGVKQERFIEWNYALQGIWARALFGGAGRIFALRFQVDGEDEIGNGPMIVFMRHASTIDTLLPAEFLTRRHAVRLRYVMKRELLWDPCLDIVGQRLPNVFLRRGAQQSDREVARVRDFAEALGRGEGVLIYPEGTRFTAEKRRRILARLAETRGHEELERAEALRHVLPPRTGGAMALLEALPEADALFLAHCGFERAASLHDLWTGRLVGTTIRLKFWRIRSHQIPRAPDERAQWFWAQWKRVDEWIDRQSPAWG